MKIDMLKALSSINLNSASVKGEGIEENFLSVLSNEFVSDNNLELTSEINVDKLSVNEGDQSEVDEVDENLIELIGALLNKINSNNDENNIINNIVMKNGDNTYENVDNLLSNVEKTSTNKELYIKLEETNILNENQIENFSEINFINDIVKNDVDKKVDRLISKLKNIINTEQELASNEIKGNEVSSQNIEELISANDIINKIQELGLNEEEIKNIIGKINEKIETTSNSIIGSEEKIQVINIITEVVDNVKATVLNEKKSNNQKIKEFNTTNNLSLNSGNIKNKEYSSNVKNILEISDELEMLSSYRVSTLESKVINLQGSNVINSEKLFNNEEIKNEYPDTLVQIAEVIDNSATTNKEIQIKKSSAETNINNTDNELNILNNIVITKSNNITEVRTEMVQQQVIRSEYVSEDFIQTIKYLKVNNMEEINVNLNPEDLGELNIKILKANNEEKVVVTLANEESFKLVKENVADIKNHLSNLDINVKEVTVEIKSGNQNDFSQDLNQQFNKNNNKEENKPRHKILKQNNKEDSLKDDNTNINLLI